VFPARAPRRSARVTPRNTDREFGWGSDPRQRPWLEVPLMLTVETSPPRRPRGTAHHEHPWYQTTARKYTDPVSTGQNPGHCWPVKVTIAVHAEFVKEAGPEARSRKPEANVSTCARRLVGTTPLPPIDCVDSGFWLRKPGNSRHTTVSSLLKEAEATVSEAFMAACSPWRPLLRAAGRHDKVTSEPTMRNPEYMGTLGRPRCQSIGNTRCTHGLPTEMSGFGRRDHPMCRRRRGAGHLRLTPRVGGTPMSDVRRG
jgi:hypothetical protein